MTRHFCFSIMGSDSQDVDDDFFCCPVTLVGGNDDSLHARGIGSPPLTPGGDRPVRQISRAPLTVMKSPLGKRI
jgi:hypothetical protein